MWETLPTLHTVAPPTRTQVTIRTAPEATPPCRGEDDGLRQAPSLVPSCSLSPRCCGTWDDDDAATSDPDRNDPDSAEYYPVGNHIQFGHVENYFNKLNEFDQLFAHDNQLIYSHLVFLALPTRLPQFQHLTKPSSTTGNSVTSVDSVIMPMWGSNVRDKGDCGNDHDHDDNVATIRLRTATTMRKEGRQAYIKQLERTVLALSPGQVVALPPPTLHIHELDQEIPSCSARTTNCGSVGRNFVRVRGSGSGSAMSEPRTAPEPHQTSKSPASSLTSWEKVGSVATAFKLVAAAIKTCRDARSMCSNAGTPKTSGFISDVYLEKVLECLESCWVGAGGVLTSQNRVPPTAPSYWDIAMSPPRLPPIKIKRPAPLADVAASKTPEVPTGTNSITQPIASTERVEPSAGLDEGAHASVASLKQLQVSELLACFSNNKLSAPKGKRKDGTSYVLSPVILPIAWADLIDVIVKSPELVHISNATIKEIIEKRKLRKGPQKPLAA
ncbi:hypothetical protein EDB83DRAFT_2325122 [Lactarius deliciosus]|nr:hypothetical protein EDB83DRAFT_2325122 [Lactarius deliciosus]